MRRTAAKQMHGIWKQKITVASGDMESKLGTYYHINPLHKPFVPAANVMTGNERIIPSSICLGVFCYLSAWRFLDKSKTILCPQKMMPSWSANSSLTLKYGVTSAGMSFRSSGQLPMITSLSNCRVLSSLVACCNSLSFELETGRKLPA